MFLCRGRSPVLIQKARHGPGDDWMNDPDDVRNLVATVARDWNTAAQLAGRRPRLGHGQRTLARPDLVPERPPIARAQLARQEGPAAHTSSKVDSSSPRHVAGREISIEDFGPFLASSFPARNLSSIHSPSIIRSGPPSSPRAREHSLWGLEKGGRTALIYSRGTCRAGGTCGIDFRTNPRRCWLSRWARMWSLMRAAGRPASGNVI